jgi:acetolactate decarboxylase
MRIPLFALALTLALPVLAAPDRETLFQVSTLDALIAGLYDGVLPLRDLLTHGDFGLGTFDALDGEMVVLDGQVYQITADGVVHRLPETATTPFAAVTRFDADLTIPLPAPTDWKGLQALLDARLPSLNLFHAVRIDGTFAMMKVRSVPRQPKPYTKNLLEVAAAQPVYEWTNVQGSLVGFRCPYFVHGVNVPGYHLHFLSADRTRGGHLLDCRVSQATLTADPTPTFRLELPTTPAYAKAALPLPDPKATEKVEK